jgi:hypothetical protein
MSNTTALKAKRSRRVPDCLPPDVPSSEELPGGLDWQAFSTRYFPGRHRHDLEALIAYGAYRRLTRAAEARSFEPTNGPIQSAEEGERAEEANGGAVVGTAVQAWEDEGGAAP